MACTSENKTETKSTQTLTEGGQPMSFSVDLYRDFAHRDETTFRTVPASHPSDYECKSKGGPRHFSLEVEKNGDRIVVRLGKHRVLDELTVNNISDELLGVADLPDCRRLLLDFSGVARLSSAMLAKLLKLRRKMESKGEKLRLCGVNPQLRSVFATTRLDRLFDITDTEAGAIKAVAPQSAPFTEKAI
jgi:anti-sigma B factor antagonist